MESCEKKPLDHPPCVKSLAQGVMKSVWMNVDTGGRVRAHRPRRRTGRSSREAGVNIAVCL